MKYLKISTALLIASFSILQITLATKAETYYHSGDLRITLDQNLQEGRTYKGCDSKRNCIYLTNGTSWRDKGYRGITWENKRYSYSVFWQEKTNSSTYLKVFDPNGRLILYKILDQSN